MTEEEKESKWKTYGYPLIALVAGIIVYYFITADVFLSSGNECLVTQEWFEEAFGQPIDSVGKNYEIRDGRICITNDILLKEIYGMVEG